MDLFGKKKIRELEDRVEDLEKMAHVFEMSHKAERSPLDHSVIWYTHDFNKTYSTQSIKDLTIQEFFDFYFDGKPIKRKEEVDVEYRKGE